MFNMRLERWYFLILFCVISLGIHVEVAFHSPPIHADVKPIPPTEIEVALQPLTELAKPPETPKKSPEQPRPETKQPPKSSAPEKALHSHISEKNSKTDELKPALPIPVKALTTPEPRPIAPNAA